jgi:hypothetical protein
MGSALLSKPRVRDWRGARNRAVRSGAEHRIERGAPQSPTPHTHNCKKCLFFAVWVCGGTPK